LARRPQKQFPSSQMQQVLDRLDELINAIKRP